MWHSAIKVMKYWQGLCKSKRPSNKSYEVLVEHFTDLLLPTKRQFFSFVASIFRPYLISFQTNSPMLPFNYTKFEKVFFKLLGLI